MRELPKVYFERLLESSPDIVVAVDRKGVVIFYNDGAADTLGYTSEEILGHPVTELYPSIEEAQKVMAAMRSASVDGEGRLHNFETEFVRKDSELLPVAISGSIIEDGQGRVAGSIGFAKDIAEVRAREQRATMGELAVGLAHEINNPLESLVNHTDMLRRRLKKALSTEDYEREADRFDAMQRSMRKIQEIIERVGEIAREGGYQSCVYNGDTTMTRLDKGSDAGPASGPHEPHAPEAGDQIDDRLAGIRLLIVDDDAEIRTSMSELLQSAGCEVATATSGVDAVEYLKDAEADMVLTDVVMPDMDGYELFREVSKRTPDLPVVLMTAFYYDRDHVIKRSKAEGLDQVIFKKPIDPDKLFQLVEARALRRDET